MSKNEKSNLKIRDHPSLTNKETEDLFKLAFRNYNHLISVADSKASLLIRVNSLLISVMIAFVLGKIGKEYFILWPTVVLLSVCLATILLAILASKPRRNSLMEDRKLKTYQRFFFGSFDMMDPTLPNIPWDEYFQGMSDLFCQSRDSVYMEIYKESFNVRQVLFKKFNYLSWAYWVFIFGLMISVISFVLAISFRS
jgi:hypothetical protein